MALIKSQPVEPGEESRGGNNENSSPISSYKQQLLNTNAFVLDGEWFYDAVAVEGEDAFTSIDNNSTFAYWGLQVDSKTQMVYYFSHSHPEEMQWLPPANLSELQYTLGTKTLHFLTISLLLRAVHPDTHEVLLWDASTQWFYYYNPQVGWHV
ncbi:hypothetical protein P3T76_011083 [Phytophthora citrophthora]|uniref:Uncharacterized protein n=1 Tax=Phytophthora citrophthora TaxID=4793 RepID=A0AAD9G9R5_9STRA|nr:hypothetical protein P3T76_011083 [Phytophthora citrophthora]